MATEPAKEYVPSSSPRSATAPASIGTWFVNVLAIAGVLAGVGQVLIDSKIFPEGSEGAKALVAVVGVLGVVLMALRQTSERNETERLSAHNAYKLEREKTPDPFTE